jgi:hypothetical protein
MALLLQRRLDGPAAESVEEMAQPKQITEAAKGAQASVVIGARAAATLALGPVGPLGWDQRATAIGQAGQRGENPVAANTANHRQRTALKRVALAGDRYRIGKIPAMGSLSPLPLGAFPIPNS